MLHWLLILALRLSVLTPIVSSTEHFCSQRTAMLSVQLQDLFKAESNRHHELLLLDVHRKKEIMQQLCKQIMSMVHFLL